jgi:hypothetical protein
MASMMIRSAILGAVAAAVLSAPAHALLIDDFITAQTVSVDAVPTATGFFSGPGVSALGGERDIFVTKSAGADGDRIRARTNPLNEDKLRISIDDGVRGFVDVVWDGADLSSAINASGLGGISLLADGAKAFALGVSGSDIGGPVAVTVFQQGAAGNFLSGVFNVPGGILAGVPGDDITLFLDFSSLTVTGAASANAILSSVGAIRLRVDATAAAQEAWDSNYTFFATAPEPATLALIGVAAVAIGAMRRR